MIAEVLDEVQKLKSRTGGEEQLEGWPVGGKRRKLGTESDYEDKLHKSLEDLNDSVEKVGNRIDSCGKQTELFKRDSIKDLVTKIDKSVAI